ncbi:MAG: hypothetical protein ACRDDH_03995 [Cetobacterium sp.]|uniref:hypothetical protein n=1 Tax=Cetobacterium sp. TaxID=2071632 RepID=UPI003EE7EAD1
MKRFLLIYFLTTKLFSQEIPIITKEEIIAWIESSCPLNIFEEETKKSIYEDKVFSYKWCVFYGLDLSLLKQVKLELPTKKFGYKLLKSIYETPVKMEKIHENKGSESIFLKR